MKQNGTIQHVLVGERTVVCVIHPTRLPRSNTEVAEAWYGAVSLHTQDAGAFHVIKTNRNGERTLDILVIILGQFCLIGEKWNPKHTARTTLESLDGLSQSPDLIPMENIWRIVKSGSPSEGPQESGGMRDDSPRGMSQKKKSECYKKWTTSCCNNYQLCDKPLTLAIRGDQTLFFSIICLCLNLQIHTFCSFILISTKSKDTVCVDIYTGSILNNKNKSI